MLEETAAPGRRDDKAELKLWLPADVTAVRATALFVPGSNGDGRGRSTTRHYPTAWLPTARVADRWQWLVTEKP